MNAICPGLFMTDKNKEWNQRRPEVIEAFVQNVPLGRAGEPEEIGSEPGVLRPVGAHRDGHRTQQGCAQPRDARIVRPHHRIRLLLEVEDR